MKQSSRDIQEEIEKEIGERNAQHFLTDKKIIDKLIQTAEIKKNEKILEIGPGTGNITRALAETKANITSYEVDLFFTDKLKSLEDKYQNIKIIYANALEKNWKDFDKVVSNIPFHLAELIIMKAIKSKTKELVLIVGSHFKNKLFSEDKIGLIAKKAYDIEPIERIDSDSFEPPPNTNSWIIKLKMKEMSENDKRLISIALSSSKIKNAIIHSLMKDKKTKKQSKEIVSSLNLSDEILNKSAKKITANLLIKLEKSLENII